MGSSGAAALVPSNNLSDLTNAATARGNLGVASAADVITSGQIVPARLFSRDGFNLTNQFLHLIFFYGDKTEPINNIYLQTRGTAAGATPTLCRAGFWSEAGNGDLTLTAAIDNDTSLFAATNTGYTRALTSTFNKVLGARYAFGVLVVSGATMPSLTGTQLNGTSANNVLNGIAPRLLGGIGGQADLPANIANGSINTSSNGPIVYMST